MSLTITIPKTTSKSSVRSRGPQYIAPNSGSIKLTLLSVNGVTVTGSPTQGPFNLTLGPTNPSCSAGANGTVCTFQISAPIGTDIFVATTYASSDGSGTALGSGAVMLTARLNATNSANLSLTGPVASVQLLTSTTTLFNGNPIPLPTASGCQLCSLSHKAASQAKEKTLNAARPKTAGTARVASTATRTPAVKSPALPTPGPVATVSRIFVIALDAAGNQIINPTTFDISINLVLTLNGLPANTVTLSVAYAGLTGEPTTAASTSSDGGVVTVLAPSDVVTMTLAGTTSGAPFIPTVIAQYIPQGSTQQSSAALQYFVLAPPAAAQLQVSASHIDPFTVSVPANLTMSLGNIGTAPTSGQLEMQSFFPFDWTYTVADGPPGNGSDASWNCTNQGSGFVDCLSSAAIAPGGSLALVLNVIPTATYYNPAYNDVYGYGGGAINANNGAYVEDYPINIITTPPTPGPITLQPVAPSAPDHLSLSMGANGAINVTEPYFNGTLTASVVNGSFGTPPCSNYVSLLNTTSNGPNGSFTIAPIQSTNIVYAPGNPATYCTISVTDGTQTATIPVTVMSVSLSGQ